MDKKSLLPNTTQIPNIILDDWLPKLSGSEFQIIMVIARQTYGWHKESDQISYSQLMEKAGLERATVASALRKLRESGLIEVLDENDKILKTKEECRGRSLFYRLVTDNQFKNRTSKIEHTKETYTKEISNINITNGDKSPGGDKRNSFVDTILKDFSSLTGLTIPADRQPRRVAWNFHQKYGAENFAPALQYLQDLWKKDVTKIETVKLHYPTYLRDVKKQSGKELTQKQKEIAELYALSK